MINRIIKKIIPLFLTMIFLFGLFPSNIYAQPSFSLHEEIKGFNKTIFDNSFSRANREINPERWLTEAKLGLYQAICSWELIAVNFYEDPFLLEEAKNQIINWSDKELEARFSDWLVGRFFGAAAEKAILDISQNLKNIQKEYSWYLDNEGNVILDDNNSNLLIIRQDDEINENSNDIEKWKTDTKNLINAKSASFENIITRLFPELLAYIPPELRENISSLIYETTAKMNIDMKREFENITAKEERKFLSKRTKELWNLNNKVINEDTVKQFTDNLIIETEIICKTGIDELKVKIEQAEAGVGDLALLGEEWLKIYKEQFEKGLKAWEDAEERFFIRRIEWEQDSFKLFSEGEDLWLAAFNDFEEERRKWELNAKELLEAGEKHFIGLSQDFDKNILEAKKEFELNMAIRLEEGTTKVKALIDMYLTLASTAMSLKETFIFLQKEYFNNQIDPDDLDFMNWLSDELLIIWNYTANFYYIKYPDSAARPVGILVDPNLKPGAKYFEIFIITESGKTPEEQLEIALNMDWDNFPKEKFVKLNEILTLYKSYHLYTEKAVESRNRIYENYAELLGTGALKDILLPDASSEDFCLDEYQIALLRAKALVIYWEKNTSIAEAVSNYADNFYANKINEAEYIKLWEESKNIYYNSLVIYEEELNKLNKLGEDIQKQQEILRSISLELQEEEEKLNALNNEYNLLISLSIDRNVNYYFNELIDKYKKLVDEYRNFEYSGDESIYKDVLLNGLMWGLSQEIEDTDNEWQQSLEPLVTLFNSYGYSCESYFLPDVFDICEAIINKPGDYINNTIEFIIEFDNCFSLIPQWLETEIINWKNVFIQFISIYSYYNDLTPENNLEELNELYNELNEKCLELTDNINLLIEEGYEDSEDEINTLYALLLSTSEKSNNLFYAINLTQIWENINNEFQNNNIHWRQNIKNEYFEKLDYLVCNSSSWIEGIFFDSLFSANYYTNRLNDAFILFSQKDTFEITKDSSYNYFLYLSDYYNTDRRYNQLLLQHTLVLNSLNTYELSKLPIDEIIQQISVKKEVISAQENNYELVSQKYLSEANNFLIIGSYYDDQYNILKNAHTYADQKRFEYEIQDSIQRWANTTYNYSYKEELEECKNKLIRAQIVLDVLSDLYKEEEFRSFNNPEYDILYSSYKEFFNRKLTILEVVESLYSNIKDEYVIKEENYSNYKISLNSLGSVNQNYLNYISPEDRSTWTVKDLIMVKDGRLAFAIDDSMKLIGINETIACDLVNYFDIKNILDDERNKSSLFEDSVRSLNQRIAEYLSDPSKFYTWSYARDYIITSLINANGDLSILNNFFSGYGELIENGSVGSELYMKDESSSKKNLYSYIKNDSIYSSPESLFNFYWDSLTEEEKKDLEFYIILTLTNNEYSEGFSLVYTQVLYKTVYNYVESRYENARRESSRWYNKAFSFLWNEIKSVNKNTLKRLEAPCNEITDKINNWINGLNSNITAINNYYSEYLNSSQRLNAMEMEKTNNEKIVWEDMENTLIAAKINREKINAINTFWNTMQNEKENTEYYNVSDAFMELLKWAEEKENKIKISLNNNWENSLNTFLQNENNFNIIADKYITGNINKETLISSAKQTYGDNSASWKTHYNNMYTSLFDNFSLLLKTDSIMKQEFYSIGDELLVLAHDTIKNRYLAEYNARESEWRLIQNDLLDKYYKWQASASLIIEKGRTDWLAGKEKMESSYKQWYINFQNEYERVNNEWAEIYLLGLEDKENWLIQAANAANNASSETLLTLLGTEGERLSRFIDTREPIGIRDSVPQAQSIMNELLQSSGITSMMSAFKSLTADITSPLVKRGMGGISNWDSTTAKIAASDLARKSNTIIADNEAKVLAHNVKKSIDGAIINLTENGEKANNSFRESMDDLFIFKGLWKRNGDNYVKNVVKGSTLFTPVISKTVNIKSYTNYIMEPVRLQVNLDEYNLINLNSIAINSLVEKAYIEVREIASEIFGFGDDPISIESQGEKREQSPGKFGAHIGYIPDTKSKMGKKRDSMFYDEGAGELGRLISEFTYWNVIDSLGLGEVALAPWEKRIWNDEGSIFTAPSLKGVGQIAGAIAATVISIAGTPFTGGASFGAAVASVAFIAAVGTSNELFFSSLDAAYGYKTWDEAAFEVGKSYTANFTSGMITAGFGTVGGAANAAANTTKTTVSTIAAQTLMAGTQTITTGFTNSILGGLTYTNENGFNYSNELVNSGIKNTLTNSLVSMASTFTGSSLTALNSGLNMEKLLGLNNLNQSDLQKLNNLAGSLAGQGVNYALGNDFTLNLLNFSLLSGNSSYNTGLLELHLGRNDTSFNFGTEGANISIDNLAAVFRGAQVWDVNNNISKYIKNQGKEGGNGFDSYVTLRAQYGYGDNVQKDQLFDILDGNVILKPDEDGNLRARTSADRDKNRVVYLSGYENNMSVEDQFRLAAILGHEAYRDGYKTGEIDSYGNIITKETQFNELKDASIARLAMGDRINAEHNWFYDTYEGLAFERLLLDISKQTGDPSLFNYYLEMAYNNDDDYLWLNVNTNGDYQNGKGIYKSIPLFDSALQQRVNEINDEKQQTAFDKYITNYSNEIEPAKSFEDFIKDSKLLSDNGYNPDIFISIAGYGCMFMSTKYGIEAITGEMVDTISLHNFIKANNLYNGNNLLSNELMAKIMTEYSNGKFKVELVEVYEPNLSNKGLEDKKKGVSYSLYNTQPSADHLKELDAASEEYFAHLRIKDPYNSNAIIHSVMLSSINYYDTYKITSANSNITANNYIPGRSNVTLINYNVANSLSPSTYYNSKTNYSPNAINRMDIFKVTRYAQ